VRKPLVDPFEAQATVGGGQRRIGAGRRPTFRLRTRDRRRQQRGQRENETECEASTSCARAQAIHVSTMPSKSTVKKAKRDLSAGKRPSTAAGEFVREEMDHVRKGKHGARSTKQTIAIGLSKARRAGVPLKPPARGRTSARTRREATLAYETGQGLRKPRAPSAKRKRASSRALKRERTTSSRRVIAAQNRSAKARRSRASRASARKRAAGMKGMRHRHSSGAKRSSTSRKRNRR